ncbi:glycosyl hydrolase family 1 domain-containing protein [Phthorimaea operculella]|nr:glycosyl hydrolase family 1 domain-containing protein [Phthorimaea operculella]
MARSSWVGRALASLSVLCFSNAGIWDGSSGLSNYTFPDDFIFGVSTAAYQIEGAWNEGGKGESIWDTYLHAHPNWTVDGSNGDIATDSYHKWRDDIDMISFLGVSHYRMSISWTRLLPRGTDNIISEDGVNYYRRLFEELQRRNISVAVTLFHWDLPTPLMDLGGWTNPKMVDYFEDYARVAFKLYGDIVKIWMTVNEPHQHCANGYGGTYFVPALASYGVGDYLCTHYILLAHARVYHLYDKEFRPTQNGQIGITLDAFYAEPHDSSKPEDHEAGDRYLQMHFGIYAHPIFSEEGDYPRLVRQRVDENSFKQNFTRSRLPYFTREEVNLLRGSSDFFGLNHYTTFLMEPSDMEPEWKVPSLEHDTGVRITQNPNWPKPGADWFTVYPPGFRKLLQWIKRNYGTSVPIIVCENGAADFGGLKDYVRVSYYNKYLYQLLLAMNQDGMNVVGYFAWTLMDVFEWGDGYLSKFGLFHVDFSDPNRTRTPKLSAHNFREIVRTKQINFDYIKSPTSTRHNNILI